VITVKSIDPCPGANANFTMQFTYYTTGDGIPSGFAHALLQADGSWSATFTVGDVGGLVGPSLFEPSLTGPAVIQASCFVPGKPSAAYELPFDVTTRGAGVWLPSATPVPAACFCTLTSNMVAGGDAEYYGPVPALFGPRLVGIAPNPMTGTGYWLASSDGGIFSYGDARYFGSAASVRLAHPVVGIAATATGHGYWLVSSDGGIFSYGDARYFGSAASVRLAHPVVGIAATATGHGYWLVSSDGGIFRFGDAPAFPTCNDPCGSIIAIARTPVTTAHM
jgi:hypothetical protein